MYPLSRNNLFSDDEILATKLHEMSRISRNEKVDSLLRYFLRNHEFTWKQRELIKQLINEVETRSVEDKKYYLIALSTSRDVYIGITTDPKRRIKTLNNKEGQTLKVELKRLIGVNKSQATARLNKLRKAIASHRDTIDWYSLECLPTVKRFKVK